MSSLAQLQIEKLDVLAGTRKPGEKVRAAVRFEDLDLLTSYAYKLKSGTVSAAPTAAQHNALVEDVRHMHQTLQSLSKALKTKLGIA
nr:hypothetical protein [Brucella anthropi]